MVLPSGEIIGDPTALRLIHFSKDTDAFFCAKRLYEKKTMIRNVRCFIELHLCWLNVRRLQFEDLSKRDKKTC